MTRQWEEGLPEANEGEDSSGSLETTTPEALETRLARIHDYETVGLAKKNRLGAALGTINAGLMGVAVQMDTFIGLMLAGDAKTLEQVQNLLPAIQAYLQTTRQIDRFAQLELKMAALRERRASVKPEQPR